MPIVVDASCLTAMLLNEEVPPNMEQFLNSLSDVEIVVPSLWFWEVANSSVMAARRARKPSQEIMNQLADMRHLDLTQDGESILLAWTVTAALAIQHRLSVYDAAYLELAVRRSLPLATLDSALARAARAAGVEVFGG